MKSEERERIDLFDRAGREDAEKKCADRFETGERVRLDDLDERETMAGEGERISSCWPDVCAC